MLFRFSLYGVLKNLRLFEAFLVLALRDRGLDFLEIGALIAVREVVTNLFEIPSGALADGWGRRRCMVASFVAYVLAYVVLGLADSWWMLAGGMAAYGFGQAFRSGTHKAMIHAWLRQEGRIDERTAVYGFTRSWSKFGSAASSLIGGLLLLSGLDYRWLFVASAVPAALNVANLASYPAGLEGSGAGGARGSLRTHLSLTARALRRPGRLRELVVAGAGLEGGYVAVKDYIQPLIAAAVLSGPLLAGADETRRVGLAAGCVSFALFLIAGAASRRSHRVERAYGSADDAARVLALTTVVALGLLAAALAAGAAWVAVALFVTLGALQNLWRPIHVGRFDDLRIERHEATVLSVESQARTASAALLAPLVGALVDALTAGASPTPVEALWPVPVVALVALVPALTLGRAQPSAPAGRFGPDCP